MPTCATVWVLAPAFFQPWRGLPVSLGWAQPLDVFRTHRLTRALSLLSWLAHHILAKLRKHWSHFFMSWNILFLIVLSKISLFKHWWFYSDQSLNSSVQIGSTRMWISFVCFLFGTVRQCLGQSRSSINICGMDSWIFSFLSLFADFKCVSKCCFAFWVTWIPALNQELLNFFCQVLHGKYCRLCGHYFSFTGTHFCHWSTKAVRDNM